MFSIAELYTQPKEFCIFISDHSISCVSVSSYIAGSLAVLRQLDVCHGQWYKQKLSNKDKSIDAIAHKLTVSLFLIRTLYGVKYILLLILIIFL